MQFKTCVLIYVSHADYPNEQSHKRMIDLLIEQCRIDGDYDLLEKNLINALNHLI